MRLLVVIALAAVGPTLAVTLTRPAEPGVAYDQVFVRDVSTVYPRPVAVARDWYDGRLDARHTCADMRQALRMFPPGFSTWSSPGGRAALWEHVQGHC
jgi:hypothetical protein